LPNPPEPEPGRELHGPDQSLPRAHQRVLALIEVLLCSSVPTQLVIALTLNAAGLSVRTSSDQLSLPFVLALSLGDTVLLIAMMIALSRLHGDSVWQLWRGHRPLVREVALGLGLVPIVVVLVGLLVGSLRALAPWLQNVPENPLEALAAGGLWEVAMFGLIAIVAGGIREELQRAFLLQRFERHLGGATAGVVILSMLFGLGHIVQGWDAVIATGALGAFWAVVYLRRRSSVAPIISHAGFNSIEVLGVAIGGS
jgi:membrane protease YdiL (CAAX protease family)